MAAAESNAAGAACVERDLRDVGLNAYDRERESAKWFWQR
jgi:uncharacterized protein YjiS (DUF1127 family)